MWTFLPLGWRTHEKVVGIIREEMDAFGAQELLMPVLTPVGALEGDRAATRSRKCSSSATGTTASSSSR